MPDSYSPPFAVTSEIVILVSEISELVGAITTWENMNANPQLRRDRRIRTIHASLAIENNSLSLDQVTAIINGKRILGAPGEIQEVKNAYEAYEHSLGFDPCSVSDLLKAHKILMRDLVDEAGVFRSGGVGVFAGGNLIYMAPPASLVSGQVEALLHWLQQDNAHPLIKSCVFHYEFEFIHPFTDGNGRMGRMWQTLYLSRWKPLFAWLPVETLIRERQDAYYAVLGASNRAANATPLIEFLLMVIRDALREIADSSPIGIHASKQVMALLSALSTDTLTASELMARVGIKSRSTFRQNYLEPALKQGLITMTIPDKPNSRNQKYRKA